MTNDFLRHSELTALHQWWLDHGGSDGLTSAADIGPAMLRRWLDNLVVIDLPIGGQIRYSYYGRNLAAAFGTDMVGQSIDALPDAQREILAEEYEGIRNNPTPVSRRYTAYFGNSLQTWERLLLPFFDADGAVEKIIVAAYRLD